MKKVFVLGGKGGVGKSTVAGLLALRLASDGRVLLLDFDICGPSICQLMGGKEERVLKGEKGLIPIQARERLHYLSMASLIPKESSVIWRGPKKISLLKMFCESMDEQAYDWIVVDMPPGLTDEHKFAAKEPMLAAERAAVIVTTSQNLALDEAGETIDFCRQSGIPVLGVVENMRAIECPQCRHRKNIFSAGGGALLAEDKNVDYLGHLDVMQMGKTLLSAEIPEAVDAAARGIYSFFKIDNPGAKQAH